MKIRLPDGGFILAAEIDHQRRAFGIEDEAIAVAMPVADGERTGVDIDISLILPRKAAAQHEAAPVEEFGVEIGHFGGRIRVNEQTGQRLPPIHFQPAFFDSPDQLPGQMRVAFSSAAANMGSEYSAT